MYTHMHALTYAGSYAHKNKKASLLWIPCSKCTTLETHLVLSTCSIMRIIWIVLWTKLGSYDDESNPVLAMLVFNALLREWAESF